MHLPCPGSTLLPRQGLCARLRLALPHDLLKARTISPDALDASYAEMYAWGMLSNLPTVSFTEVPVTFVTEFRGVGEGNGMVSALSEGETIGALIWDFYSEPPVVVGVSVAEPYRRRGIATHFPGGCPVL